MPDMMPDWLLAVAATLVVIGVACAVASLISWAWQRHEDLRMWKK